MPQQLNRRRFMQTAAKVMTAVFGAGGLAAQSGQSPAGKLASADPKSPSVNLGPGGLAKKYWMNRTIGEWPAGPWRKAVVEYHNSRHMQRLGEGFNADDFGDMLLEAHVTGATVWAKDMYGYFYYPSKTGPVHPGLSFDLLGAQVAALRKRKIQVFAYYMTSRNSELADRHPEWLVVRRQGTQSSAETKAFGGGYSPDVPRSPGDKSRPEADPSSPVDKGFRSGDWKFCGAQKGYVDHVLGQIKELVANYDFDGLWLDGVVPYECYCPECLKQLREQSLDPFNAGVQHRHKVGLHANFLKRVRQVVKETRPNCLICPQNQAKHGFTNEAELIDNTSLEGLFTDAAHYGYYHFPTSIRLARNFGLPIYGLTTRFNTFWADFGGLKSPAQMHTEMAMFVAQGARCNIGDQIHPSARLDPAVYHVIGHCYQQIKKIEPYLDQAMPVIEAALISDRRALEWPCTETNYGWVKLLTESRIQFDIVEPADPWERYALIALPETVAVNEALADRLHAFIAGGGAVIAAHKSGLIAGTEKSWLERYGLKYAGNSPYRPAYMVPKANFTNDIPTYEYALYEGASRWSATSPATPQALLGEPLFQRSPERFTSHSQTPFDHTTGHAVLATSGRVALLGFPLGQSYYNQGYWVYRQAFQKVLSEILPARLIQTDAHLATELTLTHQTAQRDIGRKERYMVHLVNFSPARRTPKHTDYCDDPIPLHDVTVRVNLPLDAAAAKLLVAGTELPVRRATGGGVEVVVPRVHIHEVICFERT